MKAIEQSRGRQIDQAADSLRRLEAVVAGSDRGKAGESVLARALGQLPRTCWTTTWRSRARSSSSRSGCPTDAPSDRQQMDERREPGALGDAEEPAERRRLEEQVAREVRARMRELAKYLDPERTLALAVLAVPDAAYAAAPEVTPTARRKGVLIVPYSMALLTYWPSTVSPRGSARDDTDQLWPPPRHRVAAANRETSSRAGLPAASSRWRNARDAVRDHVARRAGRAAPPRRIDARDVALRADSLGVDPAWSPVN